MMMTGCMIVTLQADTVAVAYSTQQRLRKSWQAAALTVVKAQEASYLS